MWLPKEGKFILLFSNKKSESGISVWATTQGRPYEIIFMRLNDSLPVCFLLGHRANPFPNPYPGSGVALRQTIIYSPTSCSGTRVNPFPNHIPGVVSPRDKQLFTDIQAVTAIRTKAAVCGKAADFPCQKHGKYKTAGFVSRRPTVG